MDNFCCTHHVNHSEKTCLEFINYFSTMLLPSENPKKDKKDEEKEDNYDDGEEEMEEEPPSHLNFIWYEIEVDNKDDDAMEEAWVGNDYNIQSKGVSTSNNSPSTSNMDMEKTHAIVASRSKDKRNRNN